MAASGVRTPTCMTDADLALWNKVGPGYELKVRGHPCSDSQCLPDYRRRMRIAGKCWRYAWLKQPTFAELARRAG